MNGDIVMVRYRYPIVMVSYRCPMVRPLKVDGLIDPNALRFEVRVVGCADRIARTVPQYSIEGASRE